MYEIQFDNLLKLNDEAFMNEQLVFCGIDNGELVIKNTDDDDLSNFETILDDEMTLIFDRNFNR